MTTEVKVPDIGDFKDVPVVTILVSVGDTVAEEDPLIELESDKATMEVPSSHAGTIKEIKVAEGDNVSQGDVIMIIDAADAGTAKEEPKAEAPAAAATAPAAASASAPAAAAPVTDAGFSKVHASPSVRAFARRVEIDLASVNGSGRKGRILREISRPLLFAIRSSSILFILPTSTISIKPESIPRA